MRVHSDCIEGIIHRIQTMNKPVHMFAQAELCTLYTHNESDAMGIKMKTCMLCNVATRTALSFLWNNFVLNLISFFTFNFHFSFSVRKFSLHSYTHTHGLNFVISILNALLYRLEQLTNKGWQLFRALFKCICAFNMLALRLFKIQSYSSAQCTIWWNSHTTSYLLDKQCQIHSHTYTQYAYGI